MTTPAPHHAGDRMAAEVAEQPAVLRGVLDDGAATGARGRRPCCPQRRPRFVLLAARGTSDHAALYAKYLVEIQLGLPCGLASPSTFTAYGARPDLRDVLVVAVSQSGGSPDLLGTVEAARACGATTLAVTNAPDSALAAAQPSCTWTCAPAPSWPSPPRSRTPPSC